MSLDIDTGAHRGRWPREAEGRGGVRRLQVKGGHGEQVKLGKLEDRPGTDPSLAPSEGGWSCFPHRGLPASGTVGPYISVV